MKTSRPQVQVSASPKTNRRGNIKKAILIPLVLVLVLLISVFVVMQYQQASRTTNDAFREKVSAVGGLLEQGTENNFSLMHGILIFLEQDQKFKTAFLDGNRDKLFEFASPVFERIKKNHNITHFYFLTPQRKVFLRVHQPDRYGDIVNRLTALEAEKNKQGSSGLELGPLGTLTLRLVVPWRKNGKLIGYIELGIELYEVTKMILKHFPLQLFVSIHKTKLDQTRWQNWQRLHQRSVDWAQFDKDVIVEENGSLSSGQIAAINKYTLTQHNFAVEVKDGGKTFLMALQPIIDAGKHNVGNLIIFQNITESKADFWMSMTFIVLLGSISGTGIFILFFIILRNVNHMIKANEVVIQASLNEKVVLLQEIHHRVKNNLQVVSSMLSLQASTETDSHATEVLKEGERRIRVMARVHENLYRSDDLSHISSRQYLGAIIDDLHQSSLDKVARVLLQHDIDDINLTIDQATPIGQITSELISNAQKHAFPHERTGTINVSLKRMNTGEIELAISDNGIGMPEGRGLTGYKSLGLRLVNALAQNLGGTVILERENGTRVSIVFRGECV